MLEAEKKKKSRSPEDMSPSEQLIFFATPEGQAWMENREREKEKKIEKGTAAETVSSETKTETPGVTPEPTPTPPAGPTADEEKEAAMISSWR
jgi:hypothetical protein